MRIRPLILALGGALAVLAFSTASPATPALAASAIASHGAAPVQTAVTPQQLAAMISKPGSYTPAQFAAAKAYLLAHPFTGTIEIVNQAPASSGGPVGVQPNISP